MSSGEKYARQAAGGGSQLPKLPEPRDLCNPSVPFIFDVATFALEQIQQARKDEEDPKKVLKILSVLNVVMEDIQRQILECPKEAAGSPPARTAAAETPAAVAASSAPGGGCSVCLPGYNICMGQTGNRAQCMSNYIQCVIRCAQP